MFTPLILRRISMVVLVTFTSLTMQPLQAALQLQDKIEQGGLPMPAQGGAQLQARQQAQAPSASDALSRTLVEMDNLLKEIAPRPIQAKPAAPAKPGAKQKTTRAIGPDVQIQVEETIKPLPGVDVAANIRQLRDKHHQLRALEAKAEEDFAETGKHLEEHNLPPGKRAFQHRWK